MTTLPQDLAAVQTLPELLAYRAARTPNATAYQAFDPSLQSWQTLSWAQAAQRVLAAYAAARVGERLADCR